MKKLIFVILAVLIVVGLGLFFYLNSGTQNKFYYKTVPLKFGDITSTISATGTVEPEDLIDVGAQVAGRIISFGKDDDGKPIDYGSTVNEGTVLAKIDDVLYQSDVLEAKAKLEEAKALLQKAKSDIGQLKAKKELAESNFARAQKLQTVNANSKADYDLYKSEYGVSSANLEVGESIVNQANAAVGVAEASLKRAKQNLEYCTITSPVKGIVIDRRVNIGQTVVSSLNAPSLFLIAKDLTRMEIWVSVNEADIGQIKPGQNVKFTVDAYPYDTFSGKVTKIRMNASVNQNVVTYVVVINTDNAGGKLLPYLTANVKFEIDTHKEVIMVANSALRWKPEEGQADEKYLGYVLQEDTGKNGGSSESENNFKKKTFIWILKDGAPIPLEVTPGISDGDMTEIKGEGLKEGMEAVIGISLKAQTNNSANSPFVPQFKMKKR